MDRRNVISAHWTETPLARVLGPLQRFVAHSQAGGVLLFGATLLALVLANSPLAPFYAAVLDTHIAISFGRFALNESILYWINDGLMALFFFTIGLEIKRELLVGELSHLRAAALPIIAATGGALVPACIYAVSTVGTVATRGWGIPMATDIAFTLGCLSLLGARVPFGLSVFVTAAAIVDDLIAVLVIALFYTADTNVTALGIGVSVLGLLVLANIFGVRRLLVYAVLGVVVWLAFLQSGVHATIAGVLVAFAVPARFRIDAPAFHQRAATILRTFDPAASDARPMLTDELQQRAVLELEDVCEQVQAPLQKAEHRLGGWVSLVILPLFALANAGISFASVQLDSQTLPMALGIALGLLVGKPLGLVVAAWLAVRAGVAVLPSGVTWRMMLGAGALAGIGFTMSIFIATLALPTAMLDTAKLAVLAASAVAGIAGTLLLRHALKLRVLTE